MDDPTTRIAVGLALLAYLAYGAIVAAAMHSDRAVEHRGRPRFSRPFITVGWPVVYAVEEAREVRDLVRAMYRRHRR